MPLRKGNGRDVISRNIREMSETHPHDQAVAAALHAAYDRARGGRSIIDAALRLAGGKRKGYAAGGDPSPPPALSKADLTALASDNSGPDPGPDPTGIVFAKDAPLPTGDGGGGPGAGPGGPGPGRFSPAC